MSTYAHPSKPSFRIQLNQKASASVVQPIDPLQMLNRVVMFGGTIITSSSLH